jgi:peptide deformylase
MIGCPVGREKGTAGNVDKKFLAQGTRGGPPSLGWGGIGVDAAGEACYALGVNLREPQGASLPRLYRGVAPLDILHAEHPVLRTVAKPVPKVTRAIRQLIEEMAQAMYAAHGVGLAAPQVGVAKRVIVADVGDGLIALVNPEIVWWTGKALGFEGCLSIPGLVGEVERAEAVQVTGLNPYGHRVWIEAEGLLARCFQHEIDHLNGVLFTDLAIRVMPPEEVPDREAVVLD